MPGQITGIEVKVSDPTHSEAARDALRAALADWPQPLVIKDWRELNASLFSALQLEKVAMFIILTLIILVASFSIVCLLIMIVIEKGREISVMKSMGASNGSVMQIFVLQGLVIGVFGTALGLGAGLLLCDRIKAWRLQLPSDVYYLSQIPVETRPWEVAFICLSAVGISLLATVYPSIQAARLNPVDGLRFD
jgi:lipoprotein-releasing system permease protein